MIVLPVSMQKAKESGNPFFIELYILDLRDGMVRIAACDEDITFDGNVYTAVPFQRGEIVNSMDNLADSCEVTLGDATYSALRYVLDGFDFRGCNAAIIRIQYPDSLSNPNIFQYVFAGYIDEPAYSDGNFTCKIKSRLPEIDCPNRSFQLACNSAFGDDDCGMDLGETVVTIMSLNDNSITISKSYPRNYWKDGVISLTGESRTVVYSEGNELRLNVNFVQPAKGKMATLHRGCNKTVERCKQYGNMIHYSGFPAVPFETSYR